MPHWANSRVSLPKRFYWLCFVDQASLVTRLLSFFSQTWGVSASLTGRQEKRWQWSPLTTVIFPWRFASGSRSATIPALLKALRRDKKSELVSLLLLFLCSHYTDEQLRSVAPPRLIQIPVTLILLHSGPSPSFPVISGSVYSSQTLSSKGLSQHGLNPSQCSLIIFRFSNMRHFIWELACSDTSHAEGGGGEKEKASKRS